MFTAIAITQLLVLILLIFSAFSRARDNFFTADKLYLLYTAPSVLWLVIISLNQNLFSVQFSLINTSHATDSAINTVAFISIMMLIIGFFAVKLGNSKSILSRFIHSIIDGILFLQKKNSPFRSHKLWGDASNAHLVSWLVVFLTAVVLYIVKLNSLGGVGYIFSNLNIRTEIFKGQHLFLGPIRHLIFFSSIVLGVTFLLRGHRVLYMTLIVFTGIILLLMGSRAILANFIISNIFLYNFFLSRVNIFSIKVGALFMVLIIIGSVVGGLRDPTFKYDFINDPVSTVINHNGKGFVEMLHRSSSFERQVFIFSYFSENDYWLGSSYSSSIAGFIPRSMWEDKPPVDTGVYLKNLMYGHNITPPVPLNALPITSSITEGSWAGYMNFGLIGLFLIHFSTWYLYSVLLDYGRSRGSSIRAVAFSSMFCWAGVSLSPAGIVNFVIIVFAVMGSVICYLLMFGIVQKLTASHKVDRDETENAALRG